MMETRYLKSKRPYGALGDYNWLFCIELHRDNEFVHVTVWAKDVVGQWDSKQGVAKIPLKKWNSLPKEDPEKEA